MSLPAAPSLIDHSAALEDPRQSWKVLYSLPEVLLLVLCGRLAGAEDFVEIRRRGQTHQDFLRRLLPYKAGLPSHDIRRETCAFAAFGMCVLYVHAAFAYGVFHMLDYVFFPGLAVYLALTWARSPRALRMRVPVLCGSLSFSLMWTAVEKFLYPQWTVAVLLQHPQMTLGFDWPIVLAIAGFIEFSLAFYLATGRGLLRLGAATFMAVFLSAMPEFGYLDLIGHVPIVAILLVVCMGGASSLQNTLRLPGRGVVVNAAGVSALYLVTLSLLFGMYYGMQRTVGHV